MALSEWDYLPDGSVQLLPLVDARVAKTPLHVLLRLQFAHLPEGSDQPEAQSLQLGATPAQAQQLVEAIQEAIRRIDDEVRGQA